MRARTFSAMGILLFVGIVFGIALRLFSFQWNSFPHADVESEAITATYFLSTGKLLKTLPNPESAPEPYFFRIDTRKGIPLLQHAPVWILLGGWITRLTGGQTITDVFFVFRILSFLSGIALIVVLWKVTRTLLNREAALVAALWASLSYLLIDYAGNGAAYELQAVLYLIWLLIALRPPSRMRTIELGLLAGAAYLQNYQSIILLPVTLLLEFLEQKQIKATLISILISTVCALLIVSPWLIRNAILVGDPLAHHLINSNYIFSKSGIHATLIDDVWRYPGMWERMSAVLSMEVTSWLPNNAFYVARKLFILAPIAFIFFCYGLINQTLSKERRRKLLPLLLLLTAHALISAGWPITKFRYFVPLLPLVFLLSLEQISVVFPETRRRRLWMTLITVAIIFCSAKTYFSVPTHTYYYDGAITTDPFSGRGEWNYLRDNHLLPTP